jgi:hypothetical protein
MQPVRSW